MEKPAISVIVPIYKVEKYLIECVDSLVNQSYSNIEIILVDDGSPDSCPQICDKYKERYDNVVIVHKENGGLVSARKAGLLVAKGDYITYVDGDDRVEKDHIKFIAETIEQYKPDIVCTDYSTIKDGTKIIHQQPVSFDYLQKERIAAELIYQMISVPPFFTFGVFPSVWTKCIKRELAIKYQLRIPNEIVMGEDFALTFPCILACESIIHIKENGYIYRTNPNSITKTYDSKLRYRTKQLIDYVSQFFDYKTKQMANYIAFLSVIAVSNEIIGNRSIKSSLNNLFDYIKEEKIQYALKNADFPIKDKVLLLSVRRKWIPCIWLIKKHWEFGKRIWS